MSLKEKYQKYKKKYELHQQIRAEKQARQAEAKLEYEKKLAARQQRKRTSQIETLKLRDKKRKDLEKIRKLKQSSQTPMFSSTAQKSYNYGISPSGFNTDKPKPTAKRKRKKPKATPKKKTKRKTKTKKRKARRQPKQQKPQGEFSNSWFERS